MARLRALLVSTPVLLALLVAAATAARLPSILAQKTIAYLPDEAIYVALGRSLAHGSTAVRGASLNIHTLLTPLAAAPLWRLFGEGMGGYRAVQVEGALFFALAAVPAYLLGRELRLRRSYALTAAVLVVAVPEGAYTSLILTEPLAYLLFLTGVLLGVRALARPSNSRQAAFLAAAAAAAFTRPQLLALPLCYLTAVALAGPGLAARVRTHRLVLAAAALAACLLALRPSLLLGFYTGSGTLLATLRPLAVLHYGTVDLLLAFAAAGFVLAPGGLLMLARFGLHPQNPTERPFALFALGTTLANLIVALTYACAGYGLVQTRYSFYFAPLLVIACFVWLERGLPRLWAAGAMLALLVGGEYLLHPVHLAVDNAASGSAELWALHALDRHLYGYAVGLADRPLTLTLLALSLTVFACWRRQGRPALVGSVTIALAVMILLTFGAGVYVDVLDPGTYTLNGAHPAPATLLITPGATRTATLESGFLYPSITRAYRLTGVVGDALPPASPLPVGTDGILALPSGPLLVDDENVYLAFAHTPVLARSPVSTLYQIGDRSRLDLIIDGYPRAAASLADRGVIRTYSAGTLTFALRLPAHDNTPTRVRFRGSGFATRTILLSARSTTYRLALCPGFITFAVLSRFKHDPLQGADIVDGALVSARVRGLHFTPDPSACLAH